MQRLYGPKTMGLAILSVESCPAWVIVVASCHRATLNRPAAVIIESHLVPAAAKPSDEIIFCVGR
jgi:hypothetical protein